MIQEILRSTLIAGTVLVNAGQLGHPTAPLDAAKPEAPATLPIKETTATAPPIACGLLTLRRLEDSFAKLKTVKTGLATWYGLVLDRHRTASGEIFDSEQLTGASNTLPFGTRVKVTNLRNGRSVVVRVNDRGILAPGNVIDVSTAAARRIGILRMGVAPVHLDVLATGLLGAAS